MFDYIIDKINDATFIDSPFPHLEINNFLSEEHLNIIINDPQIHFKQINTLDNLYEQLKTNDWKEQGFPGCIIDFKKYKQYLANPEKYNSNDPVESVGITFRLQSYKNSLINDLLKFMNSSKFHDALRKKFNINSETEILSAIQKNLSGYEISPHPDIRKKSLTYLLNINNNPEFEQLDCHTHLLEFKPEYKCVEQFWKNNLDIDRCWIPWKWCNTVKKMNINNTIVIFQPASSPPTLHAIKLHYDHLKYQRTQIYGNLFYTNFREFKKKSFKWSELAKHLHIK